MTPPTKVETRTSRVQQQQKQTKSIGLARITHLKQADGELVVSLGCDPGAELRMRIVSGGDRLQQLVHEVQPQMAVLQQHPATLNVQHAHN